MPIRLKPVNEQCVPHDGWRWESTDGMKFKRPSLKWLLQDIRKAREAQIATGTPEDEVDLKPGWQERLFHEICLQSDGDVPCEEYDSETGASMRRWVGLTDMMRFLDTVRKWIGKGMKWESREEALRRAEICLKCPQHQHVACYGCKGLLTEIADLMGKPKDEVDTRLQGCAKCGCQLAVKVYMPKDAMEDGAIQWPHNCWMREG